MLKQPWQRKQQMLIPPCWIFFQGLFPPNIPTLCDTLYNNTSLIPLESYRTRWVPNPSQHKQTRRKKEIAADHSFCSGISATETNAGFSDGIYAVECICSKWITLEKHQLTVNILTCVHPPSAEKEITCGWMCPSIALSRSAAQPDGSPIRCMSRRYLGLCVLMLMEPLSAHYPELSRWRCSCGDTDILQQEH